MIRNTSPETAVTLIPPHRASTLVPIEARVWAKDAVRCRWSVFKEQSLIGVIDADLTSDGGYTAIETRFESGGDLEFQFEFFDANGKAVDLHRVLYSVVPSGVRSTRQIDGCWVSIAHWSEDEARHFNSDLKKLTHQDWKDQIRAMNSLGIKSVLIQNVFESDKYVGKHPMTADSYKGEAFYPSAIYPRRYPLVSHDPIKAILEAADECGMTVFLGVGLYAWFDFSPSSLEWHKRVTQELFDLYGRHKSLYGWYISEEMFGSLYDEWKELPNEAYRHVVRFFQEYTKFARSLTPTKPVALAPNNIRFHEFAKEWGEILSNIDILIPFAFARDPLNINIAQIQEICNRAKTRLWVDMEMFLFPLDNGLVPKSIDELVTEIRSYDAVEQIFGYQFTGIMNPPQSTHNLGGRPAKELYAAYRDYLLSLEDRKLRLVPELEELCVD
jgi:hypothetical protein